MLKTLNGLAVAETGVARCKRSEPACRFFGGTAAKRWGSQNPKGRLLAPREGEALRPYAARIVTRMGGDVGSDAAPGAKRLEPEIAAHLAWLL